METNNSNINYLSSSSQLNYSSDDDDYDNNEKNKKLFNFKMILFLVIIIILIIIFMTIVVILVYYIIIKPEKLESNRIRHPEIYLRLKEKSKIYNYVENCMKGILLDKKKYPKSENPKISIIIPVYNKENFILRVLRSIQNQSFKDIEIIFCDDYSEDNSRLLIEKYQKEDERIVLLKQDKNRGTLINRIDGVNLAKGEYILFLDPDDLLLDNILTKIYPKAKNNNIDIFEFQAFAGDFNKTFYLSYNNRTTEPIYQPKLSDLMYYEKGYLEQTEFTIWAKLIKKQLFIDVIQSIDKYYTNKHMSLHEDGLCLLILFKKAKSYLFTKEYGMFYFLDENSIMRNLKKKERINKTVRDCFLYLEFMFNYTNNTLHEKNMALSNFKGLLRGFKDIYLKITEGFNYIYKVIDLYINCDIISEEDKKEIKELKNELKTVEINMASSRK